MLKQQQLTFTGPEAIAICERMAKLLKDGKYYFSVVPSHGYDAEGTGFEGVKAFVYSAAGEIVATSDSHYHLVDALGEVCEMTPEQEKSWQSK